MAENLFHMFLVLLKVLLSLLRPQDQYHLVLFLSPIEITEIPF